MSDDRIKKIQKAIKKTEELQKIVPKEIIDGTVHKEIVSSLSVYLQYEGIRVNLETQKDILLSIKETDKITTLAYRVALISLGASLISIISVLI